MTTPPRKLERVASDLDDLSDTIEEIQLANEGTPAASEKLEKARAKIARATDLIEESLPDSPAE